MIFEIPQRLELEGRIWTVRTDAAAPRQKRPLLASGTLGLCEYDARRITLARGLSPEQREETFLHELLHALYRSTGDEMLGHALEEHVIELLDGPLYRALQQVVKK